MAELDPDSITQTDLEAFSRQHYGHHLWELDNGDERAVVCLDCNAVCVVPKEQFVSPKN